MVNSIAKTHDIQEGTVTVRWCNNKNALWTVFGDGDINTAINKASHPHKPNCVEIPTH